MTLFFSSWPSRPPSLRRRRPASGNGMIVIQPPRIRPVAGGSITASRSRRVHPSLTKLQHTAGRLCLTPTTHLHKKVKCIGSYFVMLKAFHSLYMEPVGFPVLVYKMNFSFHLGPTWCSRSCGSSLVWPRSLLCFTLA